ncbi:MAG: mycothiol synthase [Acidimicrobiia bacterium]
MIKVRVLRDVSDEELAEVRDLLDAVEAADDHAALGEHKWLDLVNGSGRCFAGIVAEDPPHPHPVGYAHLSANPGAPRTPGNPGAPRTPGNPGAPRTPGNPGAPHTPGTGAHFGLEVAVDPQHRGVGVEVALVDAALELAGAEGGGRLHFWVFRPTQIHDALAHRLGFTRGRELYQMRRPLPHPEAARWPAGVRVRRFIPGQDEEAWLVVNNAAFAGHPEQGTWDRGTLERREAEAWFDPAGFLLAEDEDGQAGFCWTKVHEGGDPGEIYVIAVDPTRQGTGLGRALVLGGLASLAEQGCRTGMLYVDASNQAAVGLYRALGFDVHHVDRAYVADVAPASG